MIFANDKEVAFLSACERMAKMIASNPHLMKYVQEQRDEIAEVVLTLVSTAHLLGYDGCNNLARRLYDATHGVGSFDEVEVS